MVLDIYQIIFFKEILVILDFTGNHSIFVLVICKAKQIVRKTVTSEGSVRPGLDRRQKSVSFKHFARFYAIIWGSTASEAQALKKRRIFLAIS